MRRVRLMGIALAAAQVFAVPVQAAAGDRINVVATFSILADMVANVGGDRVQVTSLVGAGSDAHVFQATPADAVEVKRADLVVENGLGFEGWLDRLISASGYQGARIVASVGVRPLDQHGHHDHHDHGAKGKHAHAHPEAGGSDPHAWQSLANAAIYVDNIERGLCAADAAGCATYKTNAHAYRAKLEALDSEIAARLAAIPAASRKLITSHTAFGYFAKRYAVGIFAPEGVSTEQEAAALDVAGLIRQIRKEKIKALFVENISDPRLIEQVARETGLEPAGRLYSDALSPAGGAADTYIAMMRHNGFAIADALEACRHSAGGCAR